MTSGPKLLAKALNDPSGLRFEEACRLAEAYGFALVRSKGSHFIYMHASYGRPLNLQRVGAMAKPYQVRQLLNALWELGLLETE
jgi:hypothetical protein